MKVILKNCLALGIIILTSQISFAQLTGKIIDSNDTTPLEYATVALYNQSSKRLITGVISN